MSNADRSLKETSQYSAAYGVSLFLQGKTVDYVVSSMLFHGANYGRDNPVLANSYSDEYKTQMELTTAGEALVMGALFGTQTLPNVFKEIFLLGAIRVAHEASANTKVVPADQA